MKSITIFGRQGSIRPIITIVIILIVGVIGFFLWNKLSRPNSGTNAHQDSSNNQTAPSPDKNTLACINALPDTLKIGQKIMVAAYNDQLDEETPVLADAQVGGIIVMDAISAAKLTTFRIAMGIQPIIAVDQEGGTVQRYTSEGIFPGATNIANQFSTTQAYDIYLKDNKYLKSIGITTNFSPVVGVISGSSNPLPGRMYSTNPDTVTNYASASVRAAQDAKITPVIKHFPGIGSANGNTDYGKAETDPLVTLQMRDLVPFKKLANLHPDVMMSNATIPGLTNGEPAVWSPDAMKLLRNMGYQQAVVYTDSLTANAIPGQLDEAVVRSWKAGIDVALIVQSSNNTAQLSAEIQSITSLAQKELHSGALDNDSFSGSIARIFNRKGIDACQLTH